MKAVAERVRWLVTECREGRAVLTRETCKTGERLTGVRVPIVAQKRGNARGAKGDRKVDDRRKDRRNPNGPDCLELERSERPRGRSGSNRLAVLSACWRPLDKGCEGRRHPAWTVVVACGEALVVR